uniref:DUF4062 domain-containing protein n=1 Tax=Trichobilharzia regenti TaxID=157069 RepID=A0AA85KMH1_TRIRE|nr:unnamed protein product [Trichobilharzia regenti]
MKYSGYMDIGILQKVNLIYEKRGSATSTSITSVLEIFYAHRKQFDKVVVFGDCHQHIIDYVANYRAYIGPIKAIWGNLSGEDKWSTQCSKDGWIEFRGCTDQILRYIAEPNEDKLLERVEKIDEIYRLNVDTMYQFNCEDKHATKTNNDTMLSQRNYFKSAWSCCQLFISSTFLDMYGERDLICGVLVPALREKVAVPLRVHLNEIDLRWGVPEMTTYSSHALQICLEQAAASDIFVLLLGDRYGWVPNEVQINGLPKPLLAEVLKFYKPGMSVTEMEYHIAKQTALSKFSLHERQNGKINAQEAVRLRICVFIRDSKCIKDVPSELRNDFEEVDKERSKRLHAFKELIQSDGVVVFNK